MANQCLIEYNCIMKSKIQIVHWDRDGTIILDDIIKTKKFITNI